MKNTEMGVITPPKKNTLQTTYKRKRKIRKNMEIHIIKRSLISQYIDTYNLFFNCIEYKQEIHKSATSSRKPKGVENTISLVMKE